MGALRSGLALQRRRGARLKGLTAGHVGELVGELHPLLAGLALRDVAGLPPRDMLLVFDPRQEDAPVPRLRLSADADAPRVHLQQGRVFRHKGPTGPFFRKVAEELSGAVLRSIEQVAGDRLVLLEFRSTPSGRRRALILELCGRHANAVLVGPGDEVLDVLAPPPRKGKNVARLAIGQPWAAPGGAARPGDAEDPCLRDSLPEPPESRELAPLSWRVESFLGAGAAEAHRARQAKDLAGRAKRRLGRVRGLVKGLEKREAASADADRVRQDGELLKAAMAQLARGMESIELDDWFEDGAPKRRIVLDPKRSPQANVQRIFDRYHKLERAGANVASELEIARGKADALEALLENARAEDADAEALEAEAIEAGLLEQRQVGDLRKRKAPAPRLPYRVFHVSGGAEVRVGRTASDNDDLTFRHSRGADLWLHTADCPGSHVILRLGRGEEPDPEALIDACLLAVHFSPAKDWKRADVHVAHQKQVHKPRGAKAGLVTLSGGRILHVRTQQDRLEGILRAARGRSGPSSEPS